MSMRLDIDVSQWRKAIERTERMRGRADADELLDSIGELVENQITLRIDREKRTPDGAPWKPWDPAYAKIRKPQHSLLVEAGHLMGDIAHEMEGRDVVVFSPQVYSAAQNASREFMGLSAENAAEIERMVANFVGQL